MDVYTSHSNILFIYPQKKILHPYGKFHLVLGLSYPCQLMYFFFRENLLKKFIIRDV